jgi:2-dehydropantoate 2-reductase
MDGGPSVRVPGPVMTDPQRVAAPAQVVFLAVKTTQTRDAAAWLEALCRADTIVCVLQNGIEHGAHVGPLVGSGTVVPASVWFSAEPQQSGWTRLRTPPRLILPRIPAARVVARMLSGGGCDVEISDDFVSAAWHKLLANSLGALMALTGRRVGVFARADLAELARAYAEESLAVARADGAHLPDSLPQQLVEKLTALPPDCGTSILTDRACSRPLEWEARNGVIGRRAREHGVPTPIGDVVVSLLAAASDGPG